MDEPQNTLEPEGTIDPFTHAVMNRIDEGVRASLSEEQRNAIEEAVTASKPGRKHPVDVRGALPLFFARFYFVFLMGRDRRFAVRHREHDRREKAGTAGSFAFLAVALSPVVLLILVFLYLLKSVVGIDIFPDSHLYDLLGF